MLYVACGPVIVIATDFIILQTTLVPVRNLTRHPSVTGGLHSPIMLGTLFELNVSVTRHLVGAVYRATRTALSMLHSLQIVHCDVKPQNIFRDCEGFYHLGDYDGCVAMNAKVNLSTRSFWPVEMQQSEKTSGGLKATPKVDYMMLAATLLFLADHWNFLPGNQLTLAEMQNTAQEMKVNSEPGADEILECIQLACMDD